MIDRGKCTGCRKCETVCSVFHTGIAAPSQSRIRVLRWDEVAFYLPLTCQDCEKPICTEVCPTKACHIDSISNKVLIDKNKCIGCRACIVACPFGHPVFDRVARVTIKCDFCNDNPLCVDFCEAKALDYIESDRVSANKRMNYASRMLP